MNVLRRILPVLLIASTTMHATVKLLSRDQLIPAVQIKINKNNICMRGGKCLENDIWFGYQARPNDWFNFDKYNPFTQTFKEVDSITWQEIDNKTGETFTCSATISPTLNRDTSNDAQLTFDKGCSLSIVNPKLTVTITTKRLDKAATPAQVPAPARVEPAQQPKEAAAATQQLFQAIDEKDLTKLDKAILAGADINALQPDTPLVTAIVNADLGPMYGKPSEESINRKNIAIIERLLQAEGIDVNKASRIKTPLIAAAYGRKKFVPDQTSKKIIDLLLAQGADLEKKVESAVTERTALTAAAFGRPDLFEYLLQKGASPLVMIKLGMGSNKVVNGVLFSAETGNQLQEIKEILKKYGYEEVGGKLQKMNK